MENRYIKITDEEINEILERHQRFLEGHYTKDFEELRANFVNVDLSGKDFSNMNLFGAYFHNVNLRNANFCHANLRYTSITLSDMENVNLCQADLRVSIIRCVDLSCATIKSTDFRYASLDSCNFNKVVFDGNTNFQNSHIYNPINPPNFIPMACPDTGAFIGWKKCRAHGKDNEELIVKLLIPEDARRSSATGRKCRCDKAVVLEIQDMDGNEVEKVAYSTNTMHFKYEKGKTVEPEKPFCEDRFAECASGIHFFINRQEAVNY